VDFPSRLDNNAITIASSRSSPVFRAARCAVKNGNKLACKTRNFSHQRSPIQPRNIHRQTPWLTTHAQPFILSIIPFHCSWNYVPPHHTRLFEVDFRLSSERGSWSYRFKQSPGPAGTAVVHRVERFVTGLENRKRR